MQVHKQDLARQAQYEAEKVSALQANAERLQDSLAATKERMRELETALENAKLTEKQRDRDREKERREDRQALVSKD